MKYAVSISEFFMGCVGDKCAGSDSFVTIAAAATYTFYEYWLYSGGGADYYEAAAVAGVARAPVQNTRGNFSGVAVCAAICTRPPVSWFRR